MRGSMPISRAAVAPPIECPMADHGPSATTPDSHVSPSEPAST